MSPEPLEAVNSALELKARAALGSAGGGPFHDPQLYGRR